jgi:hypothetical protein
VRAGSLETAKFEPEVEEYLQLKGKSTREVYATVYRRFL